jgi:hypothetical protein
MIGVRVLWFSFCMVWMLGLYSAFCSFALIANKIHACTSIEGLSLRIEEFVFVLLYTDCLAFVIIDKYRRAITKSINAIYTHI